MADLDTSLACCLELDGAMGGHCAVLDGFNAVQGREKWYAGAALIDGKLIGPPLGIRSMSVTCDGTALLVNVHVGGIPRSLNGGSTWLPTLDIELDVHEVSAHPSRPELVAAAAAAGLCVSHDAEGAVYHRPADGSGALQPLKGGFPERIAGICDTDCIDVAGPRIALADRAGNLYCSEDLGRTWSCRSSGARSPSAVALI